MRLAVPISIFVLAILVVQPLQAATYYGSPLFEQAWRAAESATPNFWGPLSTAHDPQLEQYTGGQATQPCPSGNACAQVIQEGKRLVQYFDKGRMELTQPGMPVTSGLLASDLVHGRIQIGDSAFQSKPSPAIAIAGDADNAGPTYAAVGASTALLADTASTEGDQVTLSMSPNGTVGKYSGPFFNDPYAVMSHPDDVTHHNKPKAFCDFRAVVGLAAIGYAITEPFWTTVKVGGQQKEVLVQVFERRVLTYTPTNASAYKVEFGNIGQHYDQWRYSGA
jgi:hypothetical protein